MEQLGTPELSSDEIEKLCLIVEKAAREYILSNIPSRRIETLVISVEAEGAKPVRIIVEVDLSLSKLMKETNAQRLADDAVKEALASAENHLRELTCHSKK